MTQELSATELTQLEEALYAVLALVGGADGVVDPKEARRFTQMLEAVQSGEDTLLSAVAGVALTGADVRLQQPLIDAAGASERIRTAMKLADTRLSSDAAHRLKHGLYMMGVQLAGASGGGLLGLGARTSDDEKRALATLAGLLGVVVR